METFKALLVGFFIIGNLTCRGQTLTELDLGDDVISSATAVSKNGEYIGVNATSESDQISSLLYNTQTGTSEDISAQVSDIIGVNNSGQVVGLDFMPDGSNDYVIYTPDQGVTDLTTLSGGTFIAWGINDSGTVIGKNSGAATLYTAAGGFSNVIVPEMGSSVQSVALSINDSGQVAGTVGNDSFITSPDGQTIDLGTFGGTSSGPIAVNNLGHVVGVYSSRSGFGGFPSGGEYFYTGAGESHNGGIGLGVLALNDSDETVGTNNAYSGGAEMATANGTVYNLDTLYASLLVPIGGTKAGFVTLDSATGVDDSGNIIGYGSYYNGDSTNDLFERGFLLSVDSVPEPNALILLPLGGLFIELVRRRAKIKT